MTLSLKTWSARETYCGGSDLKRFLILNDVVNIIFNSISIIIMVKLSVLVLAECPRRE